MKRPSASFWMGLGAAVLALALYARTAGFDFVNYDDNNYVYTNPHVTGGLTLENIRWAFEIHGPSMWVPLTWLSHQLLASLFGNSPAPHHLLNALLHAANTWLLFSLLSRLSGRRSAALIAALLFAAHPIHAESIAWITERKDVLCGVFFLLTLLAYNRYTARPGLPAYLAVCAGTALAVMAKPLAVTLPCVLLLIDVRFSRPWKPRVLLEKLPLFGIVGFASYMTVLCQLSIHAIGNAEHFPMPGRIANALISYTVYLGRLVCPVGLNVFYPYPEQTNWPLAAGGLLLLGSITTAAILKIRNAPWGVTGWFWYLGMLFPMIGIVQAGAQSMADRYAYLPAIGLYWIAGMALSQTAFRRRSAALIIVLLCVLNIRQVAVWQNSRTLFSHALNVDPDNYLAHNNLGLTYREDGDLTTARHHFEQSLQSNPDYQEAINNLGITLAELGDYPNAIATLRRIAAEGHIDALYNLGTALIHNDDFAAAEFWLAAAAARDPAHAGVRYNLAFALQEQHRWSEAEQQYEETLRLDPAHADAQTNLRFIEQQRSHAWICYEQGNRHLQAGELHRAEQAFREALTINPNQAEAYNNLGVVLGQQGDHAAALHCFETATALAPDYAEARQNARNARSMLTPHPESESGKTPDPAHPEQP